MKTRVWFFDDTNSGEGKVCYDDLTFLPRVGEFVDHYKVGGYVRHIQHTYHDVDPQTGIGCVINIHLNPVK